jgi:ribosomal protein S13
MKFNRLMRIYWSRGLFFNGKLVKMNWNLKLMFTRLPGFSLKTQTLFIRRFEILNLIRKNKTFSFLEFEKTQRKIINTFISKILNSSSNIYDMVRYNLIRLYLIKTFRGRCQMLGKPSRGQRTWSNAWTAFKYNKILRTYVSDVLRNKKIKKVPKKINYKIVKRKLRKPSLRFKIKKIIKKKNMWF